MKGDDKMTFNECGFQERIKALRKQKGYTQQQLADIFYVSIDYLFGREKPSGNTLDVSGLSDEEIAMIQNMIDTLRKKK